MTTKHKTAPRTAEGTPSLRERAERLRDATGRFVRRTPAEPSPVVAADPFEGASCPDGFVPYPFDNPMGFANIGHIVIPNEAQRLLDLALGEYERCCGSFADYVSEEEREARRQAKRASLHIDALITLVQSLTAPSGATVGVLPEADGSGFITYKDAVGRTRREPVAYWIAAASMDLVGVARREVSRQFNAASNDLSREECDALYDRLRKEHRIDALHDLAFRSDRVFELCKEYAVGERWRIVGSDVDAELLSLGREFDAIHAEWVPVSQSGREEACVAIERRMEPVTAKIRALPARTLDGLAVKARAAIPGIWRKGQYQEDAGLGDHEDWTEQNVRSLIDECLHLAGVDWTGRRFRPSSPMAAEEVGAPDPVQSALTPKASAEAVNLADLSINGLCVLYDKAGAVKEMWGGAMCQPVAVVNERPNGWVTLTPLGRLADFEDSRLSFLRDRIVDEAAGRSPADEYDRDNLLGLRIQHEINCNGRIDRRDEPDLLSEVLKAWG
ncbi:hypothetical protein [Methylobacterium sp. J-068]|uniref:hypothetical protein n=1 Tax=Methylobacterium sp. J-068 TaxID=2836649 RepID=UPI001FB87D56|nr:hypothetical protein [Methylobacterium sp. J-068]MCJ2035773.1 hypothetical protein [Methylobacterium sp. J-068]